MGSRTRVLAASVLRLPAAAQHTTAAITAAIAALPQHTAAISTSCAAALQQQQQQQLARTPQQHQQQQHDAGGWSRGGKLAAALAGSVVAAGTGVWAATQLEDTSYGSVRSAAAAADAARLAQASPRVQAAAAACLVGPLLQLMQRGARPSTGQLVGLASALQDEAASIGNMTLADGLFGLACLGAGGRSTGAGGTSSSGQAGTALELQQLTASLAAAAVDGLADMPAYQAIVTVWSLSLLSQGRDGLQVLSQRAWAQLLARLAAGSTRDCRDEASLLFLLHTAMQQAAFSYDDGAASSSSGGRQQAASAAPRATLQEVLQKVAPLPAPVQQRLTGLYRSTVPWQPSAEGPLLVVLHVARCLPRYVAAAAASAPSPSASGQRHQQQQPGPLPAIFGGGALAGDAAAAAALVSDPAAVSKLERELFFRWRSEQLLDGHQRLVNEVAHVLRHCLGLPSVQTPPDLGAVLPSLHAAVLLVDDDDDGDAGGSGGGDPASSSSSSLPLSPPSPFTAPFWSQAHAALVTLLRGRCAPPGGFGGRRGCDGVAAARARDLVLRGWRAVELPAALVEAELGGRRPTGERVKVGVAPDYARLEALLRRRLLVVV